MTMATIASAVIALDYAAVAVFGGTGAGRRPPQA